MTCKNLNDLFAHIQKDINDTLQNEVAETVKDHMSDTIQQNVYNVYSPMYYKRRGEQGGFIDKRNMKATVNGDTLTVRDIAPLDNGNKQYELDAIIEYGWGNQPFPRPFYDGTEERLLMTNDHVKSMKRGLRKKGYKVK